MRLVTSDWHVIEDGPTEPCDRRKVRRVVRTALERRAQEVLKAGDIGDFSRGGRHTLDAIAAFLGREVGGPLGEAGIPVTYCLGNHDWVREWMAEYARKLVAAGFRPDLFLLSTGPEFRGPWQIEHGNRFDPWCVTPGGLPTRIGEAATRLDYLGDHVGINFEDANPASWRPAAYEPAVDHPVHQAAHRWAASRGAHLVMGHSHIAYEIGGMVDGRAWRVLNAGACTKDRPFSFVWIEDDGAGGVECEAAA